MGKEFKFIRNDPPYPIDEILIRNGSGGKPGGVIERFFRSYNMVMTRSPEEKLGASEYYEAVDYAMGYRLDGRLLPADDMTISIFRHEFPGDMVRELSEDGFLILEEYPGVYYMKGPTVIPTQAIDMSGLEEGTYPLFRIMSGSFSRSEVENVLLRVLLTGSRAEREKVRAVMGIGEAWKPEMFRQIMDEGGLMGYALRDLYKDDSEAFADESGGQEPWTDSRR